MPTGCRAGYWGRDLVVGLKFWRNREPLDVVAKRLLLDNLIGKPRLIRLRDNRACLRDGVVKIARRCSHIKVSQAHATARLLVSQRARQGLQDAVAAAVNAEGKDCGCRIRVRCPVLRTSNTPEFSPDIAASDQVALHSYNMAKIIFEIDTRLSDVFRGRCCVVNSPGRSAGCSPAAGGEIQCGTKPRSGSEGRNSLVRIVERALILRVERMLWMRSFHRADHALTGIVVHVALAHAFVLQCRKRGKDQVNCNGSRDCLLG